MKKTIMGLALLVAAGSFSSCSNFLEEGPELKQSNELTLGKYAGLDDAASFTICG